LPAFFLAVGVLVADRGGGMKKPDFGCTQTHLHGFPEKKKPANP